MTALDFLVIGAQKAATTTFARYLDSHDDVWIPRAKEVPYFSNDSLYDRGEPWFQQMVFAGASRGQRIGTVSPQYLTSVEAPLRVATNGYNPKLLAIVREPKARAISHYQMERRRGRVPDLAQVTQDESHLRPFIDASRYAFHIERWLGACPTSELLLLAANDLRSAPHLVDQSVCSFLGIAAGVADATRLVASSNRGTDVARVPDWMRSAATVKRLARAVVGDRRYHELLVRADTGGIPWPARPTERSEPADVPSWVDDALERSLADELMLVDALVAAEPRIIDARHR